MKEVKNKSIYLCDSIYMYFSNGHIKPMVTKLRRMVISGDRVLIWKWPRTLWSYLGGEIFVIWLNFSNKMLLIANNNTSD